MLGSISNLDICMLNEPVTKNERRTYKSVAIMAPVRVFNVSLAFLGKFNLNPPLKSTSPSILSTRSKRITRPRLWESVN
jgi:hypothetical protein